MVATIYFSVSYWLLNGIRREFDYPVDLLILMTGTLVLYLIVSIPSILLMKLRNFPNALGVGILAALESFWLGYALTPIAFSLAGSTAWDIATIVIVLASYAASNFILNTWSASKSRKIGIAVALVIATMLLSVFIPRF
ncbi:hypothetical protein ACFY3G_18330 [Streptomyces phaeochromogenes]|uniref:hypothetical protein n=1 Tax=Streptomyces phaeochromogenes TaxID=1923 RepID=UPI0036C2DB58